MTYYRMNEKIMRLVDEICKNIACSDYEIKGEFIPVESLISMIEDLYGEVEHIKEEFDMFRQDVQDNYQPIPYQEQIGFDVKTW